MHNFYFYFFVILGFELTASCEAGVLSLEPHPFYSGYFRERVLFFAQTSPDHDNLPIFKLPAIAVV
jgi:hypothetical protein